MNDKKLRTLIVDDSAITRGIFEKELKNSSRFEVVGLISNGRKAVDFCRDNQVDLVITDYDMPEMNGIEELKLIKQEFGIPVCIYSDDNSVKSEALSEGAILYTVKPPLSSYGSSSMHNFIDKIEEAVKDIKAGDYSSTSFSSSERRHAGLGFEILCIGASTGGPTAVEEVLNGLGKDFPLPILYAQHIDVGSDKKMVDWFNSCCPNTPMHLAKDGEVALKGHVYMAPADTHLVIDYINEAGKPVLKLSDEPPERFLRPAVNKLFRSAAHLYKRNCLAVLLTGMGRDGAEGCKEIVDEKGYTIAEDRSTCAVFGMPAAAIELNAATKVYPRNIIAQEILKLVK
ncbi:MAG: chemotaxis protein CheB [Treponema sp.]|nr:chemotaxis protein CheB [Treponema sp.]